MEWNTNTRIVGNERYVQELQTEMDRTGRAMCEAELTLLAHTVQQLRARGMTYTQIQADLKQRWGMGASAFRRRLRKVRERFVVQ